MTEREKFEKLLLDYGDACFACGEYRGDDAAEYHKLSKRREECWQAAIASRDAEIAQLREDAGRLERFEDWLADRVGPLLHIENIRDQLSAIDAQRKTT